MEAGHTRRCDRQANKKFGKGGQIRPSGLTGGAVKMRMNRQANWLQEGIKETTAGRQARSGRM